MKKLSATEIFAAQEIINAGLVHASEALSFFIKEKVNFDKVVIQDNVIDYITLSEKNNSNVFVLVTEVIGEIRGICYLIFTEDEARQLKNAALPPYIKENEAMAEEMGDAVMLEIDNIISASVITQFSNFLDLKVYGAVPFLKKVSFQQLNAFLQENLKDKLFTINFKIIFRAAEINFSPEFLWLFDDGFLSGVEKFCDDSSKLEKLKTR